MNFLNNGEYYVVRFENGKYYTASGYRPSENQESENIESARLYGMDWEVTKDIYLQQYIYGKDRAYEVVKVKVTKVFELLDDES